MLIYTSTLLLWVAIAQPINARTADIVAAHYMAAAVSLNVMVVGADGTIEATLRNNTGRKVGDVEVLVEYAWIWAQDFNHGDDDPLLLYFVPLVNIVFMFYHWAKVCTAIGKSPLLAFS